MLFIMNDMRFFLTSKLNKKKICFKQIFSNCKNYYYTLNVTINFSNNSASPNCWVQYKKKFNNNSTGSKNMSITIDDDITYII
jgi:hypothetical protein